MTPRPVRVPGIPLVHWQWVWSNGHSNTFCLFKTSDDVEVAEFPTCLECIFRLDLMQAALRSAS